MIKNLYGRPAFPVDVARVKRALAFIWWEPLVLLLPWCQRVAFWNWLFDCRVDYRNGRDPFLVQWLQNYWPFRARWIPERVHWSIWKYCFPEGGRRQIP